MVTNLFSIFDPSAPHLLFSNWASILMFTALVPLFIWTLPNRSKILSAVLTSYIFKEFKPLIKKSSYFLIFPLTLFTFIMLSNLFGLVPYVFTGSSQLVFTLSLALPVWLTLVVYGYLNNLSNLMAHLIPQSTPGLLMPFMVLIEVVSNLIRPLTLAVRLMANMVAGHLLIVLLNSIETTSVLVHTLVFPVKQMLLLLELAVAFIQAYVFSVLVTLYAAEFIS
uniref:ATP synthase subunit a n=1 Tax=Acanthogammarus victorii TaxID=65437 RepID=A0A1L5BW80_9CRUS|nr:ATP synthase F0 subunit 6 [Acanthogammarus victorii]